VLAADTGVGLLPWELKVFLNELDLGDDDVIDSGRFCGIYHFLASRPPTPAVPAAAATKPVAIINPETNPQEEEVVEEVATAETQFVEPLEPVQLPVEPVSAETTTAIFLTTQDLSSTNHTKFQFPPEFVCDPTGRAPIETVVWVRADGSNSNSYSNSNSNSDSNSDSVSAVTSSKWRASDGSGQCAVFPWLGAAGSPHGQAVRSPSYEEWPLGKVPWRNALAEIHCAGEGDAFTTHPNPISGLLHAFHQLLRFELGIENSASDKGAGWWRGEKSAYLDLQSLYGTTEGGHDAIKMGNGEIDVALAVSMSGIGKRLRTDHGAATSANAAHALLTVFGLNHNEIARRVTEELGEGSESDEVFQVAKHVNAICLRSVVLKDYLPFLISGQHKEVVDDDDDDDDTKKGNGACVCIELDLVMRALAAMAPEETAVSENAETSQPDPVSALLAASSVRCGLASRRAVATRLFQSEAATVRRARTAGVCTLNEFRESFGLPKWQTFAEMTSREEPLSSTLQEMYKDDIENVELYTGLLCESNVNDPGVCATHTVKVFLSIFLTDLLGGDLFFTKRRRENAEALTKTGVEIGKDASLALLLEKHLGVVVRGVSGFDLGSLVKAAQDEE